MSSIKRAVATLGLALTILIGSGLPASASFSDTASLPAMSISTVTVAAPGNVVGKLTCGASNSTMGVTWNPSGTQGVSGYRVTVHFSDGFQQTEVVNGAATSSWSKSITTYNVTAYAVQYSVTTLTTYGWSTASGLTGSFRC
jgi:hypothetical protein